MERGLEHLRNGLMVVMAIITLGLSACAQRSEGGVKIGPDDRVMRLSLIFETPPDPKPTLTATFVGYMKKTQSLGSPLTWNADQRSIDLDFLLPGLADNPVTFMLSVDTAPELFGMEENRLPLPEPIPVVLMRDPSKPWRDGGAEGGMNGGGADGDVDHGGSGGAAGADGSGGAGTDGGGDEHPTVVGSVDGGPDTGDDGTGVVECDDGGVDHGTTAAIPTCAQYCTTLVAHCGPPYSDNCMNVCSGLRWDSIPIPEQSTAQNNLRCRIDQANQGAPQEGADFCAAAVWNGLESGGCGTPCDVYCNGGRTNCGAETLFTDATACLNTCRAFSRANRNCRVDALVLAGLGMSAAENCTLASQGSGCPL